jgi:hypothetical protein
LTAAVFTGLVVALITGWAPWAAPEDNSPSGVAGASPSAKTATGAPQEPPADGRDVVQNLQLGISPGEISIARGEYTTITVDDATPGAFIDVEIDQPDYVSGGVCPELSKGPCNLVYSGGDTANRRGSISLEFPDTPEVELHSGLYEIRVRDRHTGAQVSIDLAVN